MISRLKRANPDTVGNVVIGVLVMFTMATAMAPLI